MGTRKYPLQEVLATNSTSVAFASKLPTTTEPSGAGVLDLDYIAARHEDAILLFPYSTAAINNTFDMRVWGWSRNITPGSVAPNPVWLPWLLFEGNITAGNIPAALDTNSFMADTIVQVEGSTNKVEVVSPTTGDVGPASIIIDFLGCEVLEFDFNIVTGTTDMNCLYRFISNYES